MTTTPTQEHTFLLQEGSWSAEGTFWGPFGEVRSTARTVVTHDGGTWTNDGAMTLHTPDPQRATHRYAIDPPAAGDRRLTFTADNPQTGRTDGSFTFVGDTILASASTADGRTRTTEAFVQVGPDEYRNRGQVTVDGALAFSWAQTLRRE